jgi:hypothetical protein
MESVGDQVTLEKNIIAINGHILEYLFFESSNEKLTKIHFGYKLNILEAGETVITATQSTLGNYTSGSITCNLIVSKIDSNLNYTNVTGLQYQTVYQQSFYPEKNWFIIRNYVFKN